MADFRIQGRIEQLGPGRFVATVVAHPASGPDSANGHSIWEASSSSDSACENLRRLSEELGERIRAKGDSILAVDLGED
jgi:hypothetical protein